MTRPTPHAIAAATVVIKSHTFDGKAGPPGANPPGAEGLEIDLVDRVLSGPIAREDQFFAIG
jgi:hypothetical protein